MRGGALAVKPVAAVAAAGGATAGRRRVREPVAAAGVLALAAALRLWQLGDRPGFDWDEPVYTAIGRSVADGHGLYAKPAFGVAQSTYLFHPPLHFELLGGWFSLFGSGVAQARALTALASLLTLVLLYVLVRPRWGAWALAPMAIVAGDGWLVFTNRVSWIENIMLVFAVAGLVVYDRALRRHSPWLFAATGVLLGFAAVYKHVGGYVLLAVALHYALTRRERRAHALLAMTATAVIVAYVVVMAVAFQRHGHNAFLDDSRVQLQRLTGQKESRGSIGGGGAVHALLGPYKVFAVTLVLTGLAALLVAGRAVQALLRRSTARIADLLLFSWAAAGVLAFAALKLKMGHYFMMVELPLLLYLAAEARLPARAHRTTAAAILVVLFTANLAVFASRFVARDDNALAAVASYTDRHLPPDALVLTEESVGSIIRQPYCKLVRVGSCSRVAQYLIIYRSATQRPPDNPALRRLLRTATPLKAFTGFKERITIYRVAG